MAEASGPTVVDVQTRTRLVDNIIGELQARYVAPEKVEAIGSYLRARLRAGADDETEDAGRLAARADLSLRPS